MYSLMKIVVIATLSLLCCPSSSLGQTEASSSRTAGLESLGLLLGVPVDTDVGPKRSKVPDFLQNVYECWKSGSHDCMPREASDVNVVRSVIGNVQEHPTKAVQSFNQEKELQNSLSILFNMSFNSMQPEVVRYANLHIYKESLNEDQKAELSKKCDLANIKLQLYTILNVNGNGEEVVSLKQVIPLPSSQLLQSKWVVFSNLTDIYIHEQSSFTEKSRKSQHETHTFSMRVAVSGSCFGIPPSLLGFRVSSEFEPQLIGYARNEIQTGLLNSRIMSEIARRQTQRERRQAADQEGSAEAVPLNISNVIVSGPREPSTIEEYKRVRCRLYKHNISFADLGWDEYIIEPSQYEANFCAGRCEYPYKESDNTTKHSFIQGVANFNHPNIVPPPCCAPEPERLGNLTVVLQDAQHNVVVRMWTDMIANSCGCL